VVSITTQRAAPEAFAFDKNVVRKVASTCGSQRHAAIVPQAIRTVRVVLFSELRKWRRRRAGGIVVRGLLNSCVVIETTVNSFYIDTHIPVES